MATPSTLRFRARGTALVPDFEMLEAGIRAYVGRKLIESEPGKFGFAPSGESQDVPYRPEYVKACADGDLYADDDATAAVCGAYAKAHGLPSVERDPTASGKSAAAAKKTTTTPAADSAEQKG